MGRLSVSRVSKVAIYLSLAPSWLTINFYWTQALRERSCGSFCCALRSPEPIPDRERHPPALARTAVAQFRTTGAWSCIVSDVLCIPAPLSWSRSRNIAGSSNKDASGHPPFFCITAQGISKSPVSYIPRNTGQGKALNLYSPVRLPRAEGEDTWCLLITIVDEGDLSGVQCCKAESLGQWDTRWG